MGAKVSGFANALYDSKKDNFLEEMELDGAN